MTNKQTLFILALPTSYMMCPELDTVRLPRPLASTVYVGRISKPMQYGIHMPVCQGLLPYNTQSISKNW
jgi:hypothetical protein